MRIVVVIKAMLAIRKLKISPFLMEKEMASTAIKNPNLLVRLYTSVTFSMVQHKFNKVIFQVVSGRADLHYLSLVNKGNPAASGNFINKGSTYKNGNAFTGEPC